jgi:hypothetical protein
VLGVEVPRQSRVTFLDAAEPIQDLEPVIEPVAGLGARRRVRDAPFGTDGRCVWRLFRTWRRAVV